MKRDKLETASESDLARIIGGGWKAKAAKTISDGLKWVGGKFGDGVGEGVKTTGKAVTVGAATEGGSRGLESATGIRTPRPTDLIPK